MQLFLLTLVDNDDDRARIAELFEKYEYIMLSKALGILKSQSLAEDAVQDAFVSIISRIDTIDDERNVQGYLLKTVRNKALDIIRKREHEMLTMDAIDTEVNSSGDDIQSIIENAEFFEISARIIALMPARLSEVFIMHYNKGMTCEQIAKKLNISVDAAQKRLQRAKKKLGERLTEGVMRR